jgi:hypothetical protein
VADPAKSIIGFAGSNGLIRSNHIPVPVSVRVRVPADVVMV